MRQLIETAERAEVAFDGTRGRKNLEHSHVSSSEQFRDNLVRDKCIVVNEDD